MIDVLNEQTLSLSTAARELPGVTGRGVSVSTIWRWSLRGIHGVRLETILVGGIRMTSREALQRFFERTTAAANGDAIVNTSRQRSAASKQGKAVLDRDGL